MDSWTSKKKKRDKWTKTKCTHERKIPNTNKTENKEKKIQQSNKRWVGKQGSKWRRRNAGFPISLNLKGLKCHGTGWVGGRAAGWGSDIWEKKSFISLHLTYSRSFHLLLISLFHIRSPPPPSPFPLTAAKRITATIRAKTISEASPELSNKKGPETLVVGSGGGASGSLLARPRGGGRDGRGGWGEGGGQKGYDSTASKIIL